MQTSENYRKKNVALALEKEILDTEKKNFKDLSASLREKELLVNKVNTLATRVNKSFFWSVLSGIGLILFGVGTMLLGLKK